MTIEQRVIAKLYRKRVIELVRYQTQLGIRKYGQRLDDNPRQLGERAVHLIQEGVDLLQYGEWVLDAVEQSKKLDEEARRKIKSKIIKDLHRVAKLIEFVEMMLVEDGVDLTFKEGYSGNGSGET